MIRTVSVTVGAALCGLSLCAVPVTRSDIEGMPFPATWTTSGRTTYQVEVADTPIATLDTFAFSVVEKAFDLDSTPIGFLLFLR